MTRRPQDYPNVVSSLSNLGVAQLRHTNEEWEQAFNALSDHIVILDRSGLILWANKTTVDYFEPLCGPLPGQHYRIPYYGTLELDEPTPWETVLAGALSAVMETWLPTLKGWFLISCYPLYDQHGTQWGVISVAKDITDRKRVEEALRDIAQGAPAAGSVAFFRSLVKDLSNALDIEYALLAEFTDHTKTHAHTVAVWGEGAFLENFTWNLENTPGSLIASSKFCQWSHRAQDEFPHDELLTQWGITSYIGSPLLGSVGQTIGVVVAMGKAPLRNIHVAESIIRLFAVRATSELERKRVEEALRDSEERYRAIVENAYDLIFEATPTGQSLYSSPNCYDVLGYTTQNLVNVNFFDLVHPDERAALISDFQQSVAALEPGEMVCRLQHKSGEWRWFESHTRPFRTSTGDVLVVIDARDITERRQAEEERLRATKLESVGVLAGGIAHDFNNILTSIFANIGMARMLSAKHELPSATPVLERLSAAEKACLRARDLTKQLLTFAKGGAPVKNVASIATFITDTVNFALRGSNVRCELHLPNNLWTVEVDEGQMSQVIQNLIINADQAMPDGGVISLNAENQTIEPGSNLPLDAGRYVVISIHDEGIGIVPEYLTKIFDPYFTTKQKGTGLGLATTYSIMKRHDGHISVRSEVGRGTTFYLYLPASNVAVMESCEVQEALIAGVGRVLVMDDEREIRDILGQMLEHLGFTVSYVNEGQEAIQLYRDALSAGEPFQLAIIDLTIPGGMGGKETVKHLQALDPNVIALVSSGYSNDPVLADAEHFGFKGVITKPYNISDLSNVLRRVLASPMLDA